MSEPEVKFEIDEYGRIGYRVTNEGVLLSKDEKEFIIDHITRMQAENAKLRELVRYIMHQCNDGNPRCDECIGWNDGECVALLRMRELGVEVDA